MKKLLGLGLCLCATIVLTMGSTGCTTKNDTKAKDKDKEIKIGLLGSGVTRRPDEVPFTYESSFQLKRGKDDASLKSRLSQQNLLKTLGFLERLWSSCDF